jgi:hypothetical protein
LEGNLQKEITFKIRRTLKDNIEIDLTIIVAASSGAVG